MADIIRFQTIRLLEAYATIKPKPHFKQHVINRYCEGTLNAAEVACLFSLLNLTEA